MVVRTVLVVPHNVGWQEAFEHEAAQIAKALGEIIFSIHHVGSTAIPDIYAKPILDLLIEVTDVAKVDAQTAQMVVLGYEALGEYGLPGRRYFRKTTEAGLRTHHIHMFAAGTAEVERHLAFRDYLIANPAIAQRYSQLKQQLAAQHPTDIEAYMDGKDPFIRTVEQQALAWFRTGRSV
jgi:GrpB-like predicted nucleotidyltransferase (UPF0157 family)